MRPVAYEDEARIVRELARDSRVYIFFSDHAKEKMRKRKIYELDVRFILKKGIVVQTELIKDQERLTIEGKDFDGRTLRAVVVVYEMAIRIDVVTVFQRT